ncbi:hypothetical protein [Cryobacterium sp. PAMC25264]|uniref:hypothetical protein n=1 Tax=Cryobacterium sp. PAMC25264 TaxID=2861288 RepID=UPI001C62AF70|nr:hypothetical protein [Cryobacterium sp. PAMC25264]QYF73119.1 hypothetical protein KY500_15390 [Cryobacterium sp. PAMC25264]
MGRPSVAGRAVAGMLAALTLAITLTSCAPSPTTTYRADSGETVTVDWSDYPGHDGMDAEDVLRAPPAEEIRTVSASILGEIEARLSDEFRLEWEDGPSGGEGTFFPQEGNGYGGDSLYVTFNSAGRESLSIPSRAEDWTRIMQLISDVTSAYGLGALERESIDPDRSAESAERSGSDDPAAQWQWFGTAFGDSQWVSVSMNDIDRDRSGKAAGEIGVDNGWNARSVQISYGATTLGSEDRAAFLDRIEPFEGLPQPQATTSG